MGYTGRLVVEAALQAGRSPTLVGRDRSAIRRQARGMELD
jgi:short subunit dehydrogenase-like uncharacterized protein